MMSGKAIRIRGSGAVDMHSCMGTIPATRPHCIYGTRDIIIYTHIIGTTCSVAETIDSGCGGLQPSVH